MSRCARALLTLLVGTAGALSLAITPLAAHAQSGGDVVAVRGTDNAVWANYGSGWESLGGQTFFAPATLATGSTPLYVVTGTDANLWVRGDVLPWQPLTTQHTVCRDNPAIALDAAGTTLTVSCKGGDGALWYATGSFDGVGLPSMGSWSPLGGQLLDGPAAAVVDGQMTFMVNGTDGWLYSRTLSTAFQRTMWRCLGSPALASDGNQAYFGCHGADGSLWHAEAAGAGWSAAASAGGRLLGGMLGIAPLAGGASEYVEGLDRGAYRWSIGGNGGSAGAFGDLGGVVASEGSRSPSGPAPAGGPRALAVPVLMYHYIRVAPPHDPLGFRLSVTPSDFAAQMDFLSRAGFQPISMHDALLGVQHRAGLPARPVVITFDDGYADFATTAVPILEGHGFTATDFVVSGFLARGPQFMSASQVQMMAAAGMTIGDHTVTHADLPALSTPEVLRQLQASRAVLQRLTGQRVADFAYPYGAYDGRTAALVAQSGFEDALTTSPGMVTGGRSPFTLPRVRVSGGEGLAAFAASLG